MESALMLLAGAIAVSASGLRLHRARRNLTPGVVYLCAAVGAVGCSAALAAPVTVEALTRVEPFGNAVRLCANGLAMAAAWAVHALLLHLVEDPGQARPAVRRQGWGLAGAVAGMALLLFDADLATTRDFVAVGGEHWQITGYVVLFTGYVAYSLVRFIRLMGQYARLSARPWLRRGLRTARIGAAVGVGWAVVKVVAAGNVLLGGPGGWEGASAAVLSATCVILVAIGVAMPVWGPRAAAPVRWLRHHRSYRALHPLWSALRTAFPGIAGTVRERPATITWRLARRVVEIEDGLLLLAPYRPDRVTAPSGVGDPEAARAAASLHQALLSVHSGGNPVVPEAPASQREPGDLDAEVAWLRRVARAYRRLRSAEEPEADEGSRVISTASERAGGAAATARVLTEVLAPWVVVLLLPPAVSWQVTGAAAPALLWGLFVALTSSILPMGVIVRGARSGRWDGHHVRNREGRLVPFAVLITCSLGGLAVLVLGGAPWLLIALDISMITTLVSAGAITLRWKVSMHTAVAGGAVVVLVATYSAAFWGLAALVAAIGWSRVVLRDHTPGQVLAGALIGALVGGGVYAALI